MKGLDTLRAFVATAGVIALVFLARQTAFQNADPVDARVMWFPVLLVSITLWFTAAYNDEWKP